MTRCDECTHLKYKRVLYKGSLSYCDKGHWENDLNGEIYDLIQNKNDMYHIKYDKCQDFESVFNIKPR